MQIDYSIFEIAKIILDHLLHLQMKVLKVSLKEKIDIVKVGVGIALGLLLVTRNPLNIWFLLVNLILFLFYQFSVVVGRKKEIGKYLVRYYAYGKYVLQDGENYYSIPRSVKIKDLDEESCALLSKELSQLEAK